MEGSNFQNVCHACQPLAVRVCIDNSRLLYLSTWTFVAVLYCSDLNAIFVRLCATQDDSVRFGKVGVWTSVQNWSDGSTSTQCTLYSLSLSPTPSFFPTSHSLVACGVSKATEKPLPRSTADSSPSSRAYVQKVSRISPFHLLVTSINLVDCYRKSFFNSILPVLFLTHLECSSFL